jgi:hypothetical protein
MIVAIGLSGRHELMRQTVPSDVRRKLRAELGSRTQRRSGIKSHGVKKPRVKLAELIEKWLKKTES